MKKIVNSIDISPQAVVARLRDMAYDIENNDAFIRQFGESHQCRSEEQIAVTFEIEVVAAAESFTAKDFGRPFEEARKSAIQDRGD